MSSRRSYTRPAGGALTHYVSTETVRSLCRRGDDAGTGTVLSRLPVEDDVVETAPASLGGYFRHCPAAACTPPFSAPEFLAPYQLSSRHTNHIFAPPQALHLFHEGQFVGPFVYGYDYRFSTWKTCAANIRRTQQG